MSGAPAEGYIKFQLDWTPGPPPAHQLLAALDAARTRLHDLALVGVLPDGIGFGNVSVRDAGTDRFVISGTATGAHRVLGPEGYARVMALDVPRNRVACTGPVKASSESMSHGVVYAASPAAQCVIHVHHRLLWRFALSHGLPATRPDAAYGTPAMASSIRELVLSLPGAAAGLFVMPGHEDGLIAFGPDIETTERAITEALSLATR